MDLPTILLISAAASIGATVIAGLMAFRSTREARTAIFPILREEETNRARRAKVSVLVWIAITLLLLGGWLASLQLTAVDQPASIAETGQPETAVVEFVTPPPATPTLLAAQAAPPVQAETAPNSVETPLVEASTPMPPPPTPAPTNSPTAAPLPPTPTPAPPSPTPRPALGPAPGGASLGPIEFATQVGKPIQAINPGTVFAPNTKIYAVYAYNGMQNGLNCQAVWSQNGVELVRDEWRWEWGFTGRSYNFFLPPGPGQYKLELFVNDTSVAVSTFEIK